MERFVRSNPTRNRGRGVEMSTFMIAPVVKFQKVALRTSGGAADLAKLNLNLDSEGDGLWLPVKIVARARAASSTLAAATIRLHTAAGGSGNALCAATALASLTGTLNQFQDISVTPGTVLQTSTAIWLRQTVDSGNPGEIDVMVQYMNFANYTVGNSSTGTGYNLAP